MQPDTQTTLALAGALAVQQPVLAALEAILTPAFLAENAQACSALAQPATAESAWQALAARPAENDPGRLRLLAVYLAAACATRERYREAGVPDGIFLETLRCLPRFMQEDYNRTGSWAFTRGFWAWRQLCCLLFRLGTLEFEYRLLEVCEPLPPGLAVGQPVLSVHIPSDAGLTDVALQESYAQAQAFFRGAGSVFCFAGPPLAIMCSTWLLSPPLQALLPETSGIRRFGADYEIYGENPADESFYRWLFGEKKAPEQLPEGTSLQRLVKAHLLAGGLVGGASGVVTTQ